MRNRTSRRRIRVHQLPGRFLSSRELRQVAASLRRPPRESGIAGDRWSIARIHRLLRKRSDVKLTPRYALRRLREAGIRVKLVRAREPQLTRRAIAQLQRALRRPPAAAGLAGERWSRARIAELIERRFHRRFTAAHAGRLARRLRRRGLGRARDRRLSREQARLLREALRAGGSVSPSSWTRAEIVALIEERFGVRYHPQSVPGLLKRWKLTVSLIPAARGDARPNAEQCAVLAAALAAAPSEVGIQAARWEQRYIAQFLKSRFDLAYPTRGLYRRIQRWGMTIPRPAAAGGACPLTSEQRLELAAALAAPPANCGYEARVWSRSLVARFILERFSVHYACGSIPHVLRREGLRLRAARPSGSPAVQPLQPIESREITPQPPANPGHVTATVPRRPPPPSRLDVTSNFRSRPPEMSDAETGSRSTSPEASALAPPQNAAPG